VCTLPDEKFPIWISGYGSFDWPQKSPNLTPCDFSTWTNNQAKYVTRNPLMFSKEITNPVEFNS
jgi:hypothetical protein